MCFRVCVYVCVCAHVRAYDRPTPKTWRSAPQSRCCHIAKNNRGAVWTRHRRLQIPSTLSTSYKTCTAPYQRHRAEKWQRTDCQLLNVAKSPRLFLTGTSPNRALMEWGYRVTCVCCYATEGCGEWRKLGEWRVARRSGYGEDVG